MKVKSMRSVAFSAVLLLVVGIGRADDQVVEPDKPDQPDNRSLVDRCTKDPLTGEIEIKDIPYMEIFEIKPQSTVIEYHRGNGVIQGKQTFHLAKEVKIRLDGKSVTAKEIMTMRADGKRILSDRLKLSKDKAITEINAIEFRLPNQ